MQNQNRIEKLKDTMARIINDNMYYMLDEDDSRYLAEILYEEGYRKERQGEWEYTYTFTVGLMNYECSLCGRITTTPKADKYCPNCGARMKGEDNG